MNKNFKLKMALAAGGLLLSGAALAGAPIAYDQFTVTDGVITDTSAECSGGYTCVSLDATGTGLLVQQATNLSTGISYMRFINVEDDANGAASTLPFFIETQVFASGLTRNNVAIKQQVIEGSDMNMAAEIYEGAFRTDGTFSDPATGGGGSQLSLIQFAGTATFQQQNSGGAANGRQRIDQTGLGIGGEFTYASVDGANYSPTEAGSLGGTDMPTLAYAAGDALSAVWIGQTMPGAAAGTGDFGFQQFRDHGPGAATPATAPVTTATKISNDGGGFVFTDGGSWDWPQTLFDMGTAPSMD